jgi:hypothetical protein
MKKKYNLGIRGLGIETWPTPATIKEHSGGNNALMIEHTLRLPSCVNILPHSSRRHRYGFD